MSETSVHLRKYDCLSNKWLPIYDSNAMAEVIIFRERDSWKSRKFWWPQYGPIISIRLITLSTLFVFLVSVTSSFSLKTYIACQLFLLLLWNIDTVNNRKFSSGTHLEIHAQHVHKIFFTPVPHSTFASCVFRFIFVWFYFHIARAETRRFKYTVYKLARL